MLQSQTNQVSRIELTNRILEAKAQKGISFQELADGTGLNVALRYGGITRSASFTH
jgi:cyanate lyase